jgi:N4-gp56 family major capsid protein
MADAYTGVGAVTVDQTAYDRNVYYSLRRNLYFDGVADVQATNQSMPGAAVIFNISTDLSPATATLNESTDVDAAAMSDSQVTLTLAEKGNSVITTAKLRGTSYVPFDPVVADIISYNAAQSLDILAGTALNAGTNVRYALGGASTTNPTARNTIEPEDIITASDTRYVLAMLKAGNTMPYGDHFVAFMHPHVEHDLRAETGSGAWRTPKEYSEPADIWAGETGVFEGAKYVVTASPSLLFADAGSSTTLTDVYATLFVGKQALAKAYSYTDGNGEYPQFVMGPVTDKLRRNVPVGWYWLGVYGRFREASLYRIDSSSSIGTNA